MVSFEDVHQFVIEGSGTFIIFIGIILFTAITAKIISYLLYRFVKRSSQHLKVKHTRLNFFRHFITAMIYLVGIGVAVYTIPSFRTLAISLFAGAGVLAVILGFASQQAFSNIIAGIFIVIFKPFSVGDRIKVGTESWGVIEDITLRHTVIKNYDNKRTIIPNTVMSNEKIENWDMEEPDTCKYVEIGISYDSDIDKAFKIMQEEAMKHPLYYDRRTEDEKKANKPAVLCRVLGFGDSSVNLRAYVWTKDPWDAFTLGCDLNKSIKERFDKEGIEIPFPYRTIVYKKDIKPKGKRARKKK